ncbi:MAG: hypothetical protein HY923_01740 [Elusimicrobia bacterium]|nr:hypothetical protein [Elusimicrobiota bacterium]
MKNLLLIAMFVSTSAGAQEFGAEMPAVRDILARTEALRAAAAAERAAAPEQRDCWQAQISGSNYERPRPPQDWCVRLLDSASTPAYKVKHQGRPMPAMVSDYEARPISFKLIKNGSGRDDGGVYVNKAIEILYMDAHLATLDLNDDPRGWADAERALKAFESLRRDAMDQKRRLVIDYDAIHRQNKAGSWSMARNPKERELFDEVIRLGLPPSGL